MFWGIYVNGWQSYNTTELPQGGVNDYRYQLLRGLETARRDFVSLQRHGFHPRLSFTSGTKVLLLLGVNGSSSSDASQSEERLVFTTQQVKFW